MTRIRRAVAVLVCAGAVVALLWVMARLSYGSQCMLWRAGTNFGHVPLFGLVALALLGLSLNAFGEGLNRSRHLLLTLACTVVVSGSSEVLQVYTGRTVEALDYLRNLAGAGCALAFWASLDRKLRSGTPWTWPAFRLSLAALGVGAVLIAFVPVARQAEAHRRMHLRQPVLAHFDSTWELPFISTEYAPLSLVPGPPDWNGFSERLVARVVFRTWSYPRVTVHDFHHDWGPYEFLELDLYLQADRGEDLGLRVNDIRHDGKYRDRFNRKVPLVPGPNHLRIPLAEIRSAPREREMDMSAIGAVSVFADHPRHRITIYIADLRLVAE